MSDNKSCPTYCFRNLVIAIVLESIASKTLAQQTCCPTIFAMITDFKIAAPQILLIATACALCVCMRQRACMHVCISAFLCVRVRARVCVSVCACLLNTWLRDRADKPKQKVATTGLERVSGRADFLFFFQITCYAGYSKCQYANSAKLLGPWFCQWKLQGKAKQVCTKSEL